VIPAEPTRARKPRSLKAVLKAVNRVTLAQRLKDGLDPALIEECANHIASIAAPHGRDQRPRKRSSQGPRGAGKIHRDHQQPSGRDREGTEDYDKGDKRARTHSGPGLLRPVRQGPVMKAIVSFCAVPWTSYGCTPVSGRLGFGATLRLKTPERPLTALFSDPARGGQSEKLDANASLSLRFATGRAAGRAVNFSTCDRNKPRRAATGPACVDPIVRVWRNW